jgi:hypothetical protein
MSYVEHCSKHGQYHADYICGDCVEEMREENVKLRAILEEALNRIHEDEKITVSIGFVELLKDALK